MKNQIKSTFIITGATGSIGRELATLLAGTSKPIVLACRNIERAEELRKSIVESTGNKQIYAHRLCLESRQSIVDFAKWLTEENFSVHALINNAGVMQRNYTVNEEGQEITFAVNYLGTLMLTYLTIPLIEPGGHIVFTTSMTRRLYSAEGIAINEPREMFSQLGTYGRSKAALSHYAIYMAQHYPDIHINCADPGVVNSNMIHMDRWYDPIADLLFRPIIRSPKQGAKPTLKALTLKDSGNVVSGHFIRRIPYSKHDQSHGHLVEATRDYLVKAGIPI